MSKKNNMKNNLKERFDKNSNYNQILSKIERKNYMKRNKWIKYSLTPIYLVFIVSCVMLLKYDNSKKAFITDNGHKIIINKIKEIGAYSLDADVRLDTDIEVQEKFNEYFFINDLKIPNDLKLSSKYLVYTKKFCETKENCQNLAYDILHDYVLWYEKEINNLVVKKINISFSKDYEPLRDYVIKSNNLKTSKINSTELKISSYHDMYIATFTYNNLKFDIETEGISETELIELLESIINKKD